jgi:alpha-ketoglutarate-dependent 2,4-dichlorophenoxyacetate dioxygenase
MFALGNQLWHTDSSFKQTPASYSLLHAHAVPPEGGETQFVDMRVAWETLPPKLQARIQDLSAEHSIFCSRAKLGFTDFTEAECAATPPVHRPVVRMHPGSGRKTLYLASHASHIVGWPVPDGPDADPESDRACDTAPVCLQPPVVGWRSRDLG